MGLPGFTATGYPQLPALPTSLLQQLGGTSGNSSTFGPAPDEQINLGSNAWISGSTPANSSSTSSSNSTPDTSTFFGALGAGASALSNAAGTLSNAFGLTPIPDSLLGQATAGVTGSGSPGWLASAQTAVTGFFKSGAFYALGLILIGVGIIALVLSNKNVQEGVRKLPPIPIE